jgi:hypothetical protein
MIGRTTDAGMRGIDDTEGEEVESSACEAPLLICGDVEVEGVDVGCTDAESAGPGDAVEEGSTFTDVPDADSAAC